MAKNKKKEEEDGAITEKDFLAALLLFAAKIAIQHFKITRREFLAHAQRAYTLSEGALDSIDDPP
jgi:hypothetical protein